MTTFDCQQLLGPQAYGHAVSDFQLLETHISWVILTGEWAYKLKKPVDFGFLDYSTLERRRLFCHEELRLNRRLAPELYVEVVSLNRNGDQLRFEGPGEVVEYAVKMRQFSQHSLYDRQLQEGRLTTPQMDRLGRFVAHFHADAAVAAVDSSYGEPAAVQGPCLDNFTTLLQLEPQRQEVLLQLQRWTEEAYVSLEPVLAMRKSAGHIREVHGDLHLGNVAEMNGQPMPFDGIEFDPSLRWTDTVNDLAFLVSDLEHRGRADLGRVALDAYLEESGDYGGLKLWDYYEIYRWMVRAKVVALRKGQGHPEVDEDIGIYLKQAQQRLQPRQPRLVITHGLSGSGKTVFTQSLLEKQGYIRLRSDVIRKRLHGLTPEQSSDSGLAGGIYTVGHGQLTYNTLAEQARVLLGCGHSVVVDATFLKRAQRDLFRDLAAQQKVPFRMVHLEAPEATLRERICLRQREGRDASEADLEVLEYQLRTQEPLGEDESGAWVDSCLQ